MLPSRPNGQRALRAVGFLVAGALGTAVLTTAATGALDDPLLRAVHDAYYGLFGPYRSRDAAGFVALILSTTVAGVGPVLAADYVTDRGDHAHWLLGGLAILPVPFFAAVALYFEPSAGVQAMVAVAATSLVVPLGLRFGFGVRSGGVPAMVGVIPLLVFLIVAGIAVSGIEPAPTKVVAEEVTPAQNGTASVAGDEELLVTPEEWANAERSATATPTDGPVADFRSVPIVRKDLFSNCVEADTGHRECELRLDGYRHERRAIEFLDRHGVVCPSETLESVATRDSFVAVHDGTRYRVRCT